MLKRKSHNEEGHGWDKERCNSTRREILHKKLEEIYNRKHQYLIRVQSLLRPSHAIHIQKTVTKIADWVDTYNGTFAVMRALD